FAFYDKTLSGVTQLPERWKRCVDKTDWLLGMALGQPYVDVAFAGSSKEIARRLLENVEEQERILLDEISWMDAPTKEAAIKKLDGIVNQTGYPDKWRDYSSAEVTRENYLRNIYKLTAFNSEYQMAKIGRPLERNDWDALHKRTTPQTVNAFYQPLLNA